MSKPDLPKLLEAVEALAVSAGEEILSMADEARANVAYKDDGSPVTPADKASEAYILKGLGKLTPDIPVVSEEAAEEGRLPEIKGETFWSVDPLDGTRVFADGGSKYSINIALIEGLRPVLGLFYYPEDGTLCAAAGPGTAYYRAKPTREKQPMASSPPSENGMRVVVAGDHSREDEEIQEFLKSVEYQWIRHAPGCYKFKMLANGEADMFVRYGMCYDWDLAAGHAIVEAAGGSVRTMHGAPIVYGSHGFKPPPFIAKAYDPSAAKE